MERFVGLVDLVEKKDQRLEKELKMKIASNSRNERRVWKQGAVGLVALGVLGLAVPACLDRPVAVQQSATVKISTVQYMTNKVNKIDLLFMIDNSASMADKQQILAEAVPDLVGRLTNPVCVNSESREWHSSPATVSEDCPEGTEREFDPITDIHIGIVTSSLGSQGFPGSNSPCMNDDTNNTRDQQAHLARFTLAGADPTYAGKGFLNWDPKQEADPPGEEDVTNLVANFKSLVVGVGEVGCGFEHSLEAWYRFLVDPKPYQEIMGAPGNFRFPATEDGLVGGPVIVDQKIIDERKAFLRSDSLVAVIMLTDEDDCSANIEAGTGYLPMNAGSMMRPSDACLTNPDSPDCRWCWDWLGKPANEIPENCKYLAGKNDNMLYDREEDALNMRCFDQKRRFGRDFLFPISRYVNGLRNPILGTRVNKHGETVNILNPLYCTDIVHNAETDQDGCRGPQRQQGLVFLAGIVGVPSQDIANNPDDLKQGYMPAEQMGWKVSEFNANGVTPPQWLVDLQGEHPNSTVWNVILGDTKPDHSIDPNVDPIDMLMKDSIDERRGTNPVFNTPLLPSGQFGNPINGAEKDPKHNQDLQYACIFDLTPHLDCSNPLQQCDCSQLQNNKSDKDPLCYDEATGNYVADKQFRAKAYPGRRQLATLKGLGSQAIVASICPSNTVNPIASDYGYRPAIAAIVDRLKSALAGVCWDQSLKISTNEESRGKVDCTILEATPKVDGECPPCTGVRQPASDMQEDVVSHDESFVANKLGCLCVIKQATPGDSMRACTQQDTVPGLPDGAWCYIDPAQVPSHNESIVAGCPKTSRRIIRFVGDDVPRARALIYLQCGGGAIE